MSIKDIYALYRRHPHITTDSRHCPPGSIFLALKGSNFNGNLFAPAALESGCAYAIVDEASSIPGGDPRYILVDDCLQTFKLLAREHRRRFHIPVLAITGTNGKTTTKELVSRVLSERFNVLYTEGNFNNDVGVPKTLFRLTAQHQVAVIEMGASHPGDIMTLALTAEPLMGIITNVGMAHLEGFGSFEGVKATKGELYDYLRSVPEATVFIDASNPHLMTMAEGLRCITYGGGRTGTVARPYEDEENAASVGATHCGRPVARKGHTRDVEGELEGCDPFLRFRWRRAGEEWHHVDSHLIGSYNLPNMLAAIAVGLHFGIEPRGICHALESYVPSNSRSQLLKTASNSLVVDAYNANPTSMQAAIENFSLMQADGKMVIIGQMGELGAASSEEHERLVCRLGESRVGEVWLVGDLFFEFEREISDRGFRLFHDVGEVKEAILSEKPRGRCILIKGSHSVGLSGLVDVL